MEEVDWRPWSRAPTRALLALAGNGKRKEQSPTDHRTNLMTKLKNEWAIAKIRKGLGILERALYPGNLPLLALQ
ncbi:Viral Protein-Binding Protein C1-Like [Manis pentadactyla]|nr:Viral Protein-Binding Protein C1-Like [Manis pentadactyla]